MSPSPASLLFVCTGNAARSVMGAALMRRAAPHLQISSAGTHSIAGLPMSVRTRGALDAVGVADPEHRSTQLDAELGRRASLIVVFEPMHVTYVRREHPDLSARTASLPRLARDLGAGPLATLSERVASLDLAEQAFEPWEEVVDPAGGDLPDFERAAFQIASLIETFAPKVGE